MQACFFSLSEILPQAEAIDRIKKAIAKTYGKRGDVVVKRNYAAVDLAVLRMAEVPLPGEVSADAAPASCPRRPRATPAGLRRGRDRGDDRRATATRCR